MSKFRPNMDNLPNPRYSWPFLSFFCYLQQFCMYLERLGCGKSQANSHISRDRCPKSPPQICQNTRLHWIQLQSDPVDVSKSLKCPPYTSQGWNTATQDTFVHFVGFYATFGLQNRPKTRHVCIFSFI